MRQGDMDWTLLLWPWRGAVPAFLLALAVGVAARRLGRPALAGAAAGIGVLAGWWVTFGLLTASPRQLPERLPLLMLGLAVLVPAALRLAARAAWIGPALAGLGAAGVGWWMAGAPLVAPDLARAWPVLAGVAALALGLALRLAGGWRGPLAAAALLGGLVAAGLPGPQPVLGAVLLAAALGAAAGGAAAPGVLAALPLAGGLAALAAIPVLARGAPADWAAGAAPAVALWLGGALGALLPGRAAAPVGAGLAGAAAVLAAWLLR